MNCISLEIIDEWGYDVALMGLSLSYGQELSKMPKVAEKLYKKTDEESKFLRFMKVAGILRAPRFFLQQWREYSIGVDTQSGSTMHNLLKRPLNEDDFSFPVSSYQIDDINRAIREGDLYEAKSLLPESYNLTIMFIMNYQVVRRIIKQRKKHKLPEWNYVISVFRERLKHPEFIKDLYEGEEN